MFLVYVVLYLMFLVVSTSAIDCLERLVSEIIYYVSSGTLNPTHLFTPLDGPTGFVTSLDGLTDFVALLDGLAFSTATPGILVELQQLHKLF